MTRQTRSLARALVRMATVVIAAALLVIQADRTFGPSGVPTGHSDQLGTVAAPQQLRSLELDPHPRADRLHALTHR